MIRDFCICICLALVPVAVRAANKPHAAADGRTMKVWPDEDLGKLHNAGLISVIGPVDQEKSTPESAPQRYEAVQNPHWLHDEPACRQPPLREFQKALEDAQSLARENNRRNQSNRRRLSDYSGSRTVYGPDSSGHATE